MAGRDEPLRGDEGSSALEVAVAVERRLPRPRARRRAAAAHHPAPAHSVYKPSQHASLGTTRLVTLTRYEPDYCLFVG